MEVHINSCHSGVALSVLSHFSRGRSWYTWLVWAWAGPDSHRSGPSSLAGDGTAFPSSNEAMELVCGRDYSCHGYLGSTFFFQHW